MSRSQRIVKHFFCLSTTCRIVLGVACFLVRVFSFGDEPPRKEAVSDNIRRWIAELGDDSFVVRQRAEAKLTQAGIDAFAELKKALKSDDVEVVRRAQQILSQLELSYFAQETEAVRRMVDLYAEDPNTVQKGLYLWILANPTQYPEGEALRTLARIARFDAERDLRVEAAKCLIVSPPFALSRQKTWYQSLRDAFAQSGDDELLQMVYHYAKIRCDIFELREKAEAKANEDEMKGAPFLASVPLQASDDLKNQIRRLTATIAAFQAKPDSSCIQPGNRYDILLFWAVAELQDAVGLAEERDRTLQAALAVRTGPIRSDASLLAIDPLDEKSFSEHYIAANYLRMRDRLLWAEPFYQLAIREGSLEIKEESYNGLLQCLILREKYKEAVELLEKKLELTRSQEFKARRGDFWEVEKKAQAAKFYCLARIAVQEGDWSKVKEHVDKGLTNDPNEVDTLILAHQLPKHLPTLDEGYRNQTQSRIKEALNQVENFLGGNVIPLSTACNQAAWIMANTDGDFRTALALIQVADKAEPDSSAYLDTMAHVYALGKDYAKAIEIQKRVIRLCPEADVFRSALSRFQRELDSSSK